MLAQKQLIRHDPSALQFGDCHRTALACLLDLPVEEAPHFIGEYERRIAADPESTYNWVNEQERWLNSCGYTSASTFFDCAHVDDLFHAMAHANPHVFYLLGGSSPRGVNHTVICRGGDFYHDPHPNNDFLTGPLDNGFWEVTFILPLTMKDPLWKTIS